MVVFRGRGRQADCLDMQAEGWLRFRFGASSAPLALVALTTAVLLDGRTPLDRFSYVSGNLTW